MNRISPYPQLPIVSRMGGGFFWYLSDSVWKQWAVQANSQLLDHQQERQDSQILKEGPRRFIFRLKSAQRHSPRQSVVVKSFPMTGLKMRLLRYRRYGPAEVGNLLEAAGRGLPVPQVFGYGQMQRGPLVLNTMVMMEDLAPRTTIGALLSEAQGQASRQGQILDRATPLFVQLYRKACNNVDVNPQSLWVSDDPGLGQRINDFQYTRFLNKPSPKVLMSQGAYFAHCCRSMVHPDILHEWIARLLVAADIEDADYWLEIYGRFCSQRRTVAQRRAIG